MRLHPKLLGWLGALAVSCSMAAVGFAAVPGAALATCANITGSGSSLQSEQQTLWTGMWGGCATVTYTSTSSGKGLAEFGVGSGTLVPGDSGNGSKLDAFVGTDDPPTLAQLTEIETAGKTKAWTAPVVAAPVAIILHPPASCKLTLLGIKPILGASLIVSLFLGKLTWEQFLLKLGIDHLSTCSPEPIKFEVRSDSSGTSYAFKQYLCQLDVITWGATGCESGEGFVTDAATWPTELKAETEHEEGGKKVLNEGSKGEANAVKETEGSIGYVNLANAVSAGFEPVGEGAGQSTTEFWLPIEGGAEGSGEVEEPVKESTKGNCPTSYSFENSTIETEAEKGSWSRVHLAENEEAGAYPLCTFTYDVGWASYTGEPLNKEYGSKGAEVGSTAKAYFEYMTKTGTGKGQNDIANYYSPLPGNVQIIAEKIAVNDIG